MNRIARFEVSLALLALGAASLPCVADERGTVDRFERAQPTVSRRDGDAALRLSFYANGREYRLRLAPNPRLDRWSVGRWHQYTGAIEGNGRSWARLAVAEGAV